MGELISVVGESSVDGGDRGAMDSLKKSWADEVELFDGGGVLSKAERVAEMTVAEVEEFMMQNGTEVDEVVTVGNEVEITSQVGKDRVEDCVFEGGEKGSELDPQGSAVQARSYVEVA
ncbi:hypothetical protein Droror1_Dr00011980 [Drosera rotundifolia]